MTIWKYLFYSELFFFFLIFFILFFYFHTEYILKSNDKHLVILCICATGVCLGVCCIIRSEAPYRTWCLKNERERERAVEEKDTVCLCGCQRQGCTGKRLLVACHNSQCSERHLQVVICLPSPSLANLPFTLTHWDLLGNFTLRLQERNIKS